MVVLVGISGMAGVLAYNITTVVQDYFSGAAVSGGLSMVNPRAKREPLKSSVSNIPWALHFLGNVAGKSLGRCRVANCSIFQMIGS
jgi:hypothetical protein